MSAENKEARDRFQVSMSPATRKRLDDYCARVGVSRSAYISMIVAQTLDQIDTLNNALVERVADFLKTQGDAQGDARS